ADRKQGWRNAVRASVDALQSSFCSNRPPSPRLRSRSSTNRNLYIRSIGCKGPCDTEYRQHLLLHFLEILRQHALGLEADATMVGSDTQLRVVRPDPLSELARARLPCTQQRRLPPRSRPRKTAPVPSAEVS